MLYSSKMLPVLVYDYYDIIYGIVVSVVFLYARVLVSVVLLYGSVVSVDFSIV